ncbi:hypothetical protein scyTo_0000473 [Scyliorhinus torazame]|uniref:SMB domain-containing protein n=1 Tax=Scyliorhinus torazame TaxID=75743 RepID=A0A401NY76_SCYTO|nr:hypothetical protein [Scyliorhinus torazame]
MASKARVILHVFLITFAYAEGYGYGSCRYNCGGYSSDCSCDYNCWNYGNCCSDFCDHCSYMSYGNCNYYSTTEISEPPSIGHGSCRYNCGGSSSDCSCDYNCQYYGSCCPDFCDHCPNINYGKKTFGS